MLPRAVRHITPYRERGAHGIEDEAGAEPEPQDNDPDET
jgi:hypothetical protein